MEILKWKFFDAPLLRIIEEVQVSRVLVVTDCALIEAEARRMGATSLRTDQLRDIDAMENALTNIGATRDIIVVSRRSQSLTSLTQEQWQMFSRHCLELLRWVFAQNRQIHLLSFHSYPDVVVAIFDGLARSASLEMPLVAFTSAQFPASTIKITLKEWIEQSLAQPNTRLKFNGLCLSRQMLVPVEQPAESDSVLQTGDNIIIIGGAGGVGRELCQFLQTGTVHKTNVFVLGRKTPDIAFTQILKKHGIKSYLRVDATDYSAMDEVFAYIHQTFGPIKAVFNLAGVLDDCLFHNLTDDRLQNVLRPKVSVVLNLVALVKEHQPQYVVNFSSLTATIGNIGQSAYAAANEFVERVSEQIPGWYCFAWGLWCSEGMQMVQGTSGLRAMPPLSACECMMSALARGERHLVIFDGDNDRITELRDYSVISIPPANTKVSVTEQLLSGDIDTLTTLTKRWLTDIVRSHSGLKTVNETDNLLDMGIDSIGSIQISTDIAAQLSPQGDFKLSRAVLFECPTIAQLAEQLIQLTEPLLRTLLQPAVINNIGIKPEPKPERINAITAEMEPLVVKSATTVLPEVSLSPLANAYRGDDIAIIGVAGEFPNGATLEAFWTSLQNGEDTVTVIPEQRWNWRLDYTATSAQVNKTYGRHGGFIDGVYEFDPAFFNIAPVDAELLDPQERRFLQVSYHALEDAGFFIAPTSEMSVFVAAMFGHYQDLTAQERVINSSFASIANRVSYSFDLHGPSLTLDTMCSGSLTALHMACNSLRLKECEVALAGGVNIMSHPGKYRLLSQGKFLSASGHCHAFGIEADGYVPGEGIAAVVMKPVADAIRDKDNIYAIVRATAINSGGKTSSFSVPSVRAQQHVIQAALSRSGINPSDVNYVEAHGTGTSLGDPIELQALQKAYGENSISPCYLGSVKSNIGHLESVAAMAGLFKVIQQFAYEQLVPTLHCAIENPFLNIEKTRFQLVRKNQPWPLTALATRFAGLSSFGAGGANGHAILQQYIPSNPEVEAPQQEAYLILLSATNQSCLKRIKQQLADYILKHPDISLYGLSYTLCCARQHHCERNSFVVQSMTELLTALTSGHIPAYNSTSISPVYKYSAQAYLQGSTDNLTNMFPVKKLIRLPHYPFVRNLYLAPSLKFASDSFTLPPASLTTMIATTKENNATPEEPAAVLLKPNWWPREQMPSITSPSVIVVMASSEQELPSHIGTTKILCISPGEYLQIMDEKILLRPESDADVVQILNYLTEELGQEPIYWVNLNVHWTSASALVLAKGIQSHQRPCSLLFINDEYQMPEDIAMASVFRVLALENSFIHVAQIHIEEHLTSNTVSDWQWILSELVSVEQEFKEVKRHNYQRWERELNPLELTQGDRLRKGGVYLIAGGMGMIGKEIALHLHALYDAKVILVGRSPLSPEKQVWLQQWQSGRQADLGGQLCYMQADITILADTEQLVENLLHCFGRLDGVIHSAGVLKDALVQNKSLADFQSVMEVKVQGVSNLDRCTMNLSLDFFCLFSSMSSILGNVGQCDYVAANRFLDEFAAQRNRQVKKGERRGHTLSINWPLWIGAQDGNNPMDRYRSLADYLQKHYGFIPLTLTQGANLFIRWINGVPEHCSQIMGLLGDREKIMSRFVHINTVDVTQETQTVSTTQIEKSLTHIIQQLTQLAEEDISTDKSWGDLGLNSVMIQTLADTISSEFSTQIPPNALFTHGNIYRMAKYLAQQSTMLSLSDTVTPNPAVLTEHEHVHEDAHQQERRFAIIGMSGVMPGAMDLAEFWKLLTQNRSAIRGIERWQNNKECYAGTIDNIDQFDAKFFELSAREAMLMDPQHRLFLQTSYNALMNSGYSPRSLTDVGVFAGVQFTDYQTLLQIWGQSSHPYAATGNAHAMLANRVSYLFNFNGPSQTVDTACSSALVAVNRGVMSLQNNECSLALVGAVSLLIDPAITDAAKSMGVLSPESRCATFDENANGYVRGEGVGCVIIKRLADALRDGDSIYGVIESSVENHGGRANSLTAPNPQAQAALLRKAYTVDLANRVSYIETHGTGTKLGDPVEIDALQQAFKTMVPARAEGSIALGAVKTNIGHLEPAAGIASLLKVLLCLQHQSLPANIHLHKLNPMIHLNKSPFRLLTQNQPWESSGNRVAGISCFGFGGSNTHLVVSEAPTLPRLNRIERSCWLITLSAKSSTSLEGMRQQLLDYLRASPGEIADIAFTLACGREPFSYRMSWISDSIENLSAQVKVAGNSVVEKCCPTEQVCSPLLNEFSSYDTWMEQLRELQVRFQQGATIDWIKLYADGEYRRLHLPGYVFDTKSYWFKQAADSTAMKEVNHGN